MQVGGRRLAHLNPVVDVEPLRVVVELLRDDSYLGHPPEGPNKVVELVRLLDRVSWAGVQLPPGLRELRQPPLSVLARQRHTAVNTGGAAQPAAALG